MVRTAATKAILDELARLGDPERRAGMARYGIKAERAFGVSIPALRTIAKRLGRDHDLALGLWDTGVHEARILAGKVADPGETGPDLMDAWTAEFDSWDLCDQVCMNLYEDTAHRWAKAREWSRHRDEFVKRAGFALMARLAVSDKAAPDADFIGLLPLIEGAAADPRNFVKKAVNWALRQIGKRNRRLHAPALDVACRLAEAEAPAARWVGRDAVRELTDAKTLARLAP